ncbi:hypothetical protein BDU57DRAFT_524467 [Ampelomyces quisqualis]|uniref:RING-type domain-containing protein n=1 Tax=Ampelomyces quisqualis TaxID=50730 RepID=A0A6A5Q7D7_AMPQU|nr:hypothetical protein BDU57DRAFT_524467 [Ampelomyces quisqualis]
MATTTTTNMAITKATFLAEGFDLTILDTTSPEQDCAICTKPIYQAKCDNDAKSHNHGPHCSPAPNDKPATPAPIAEPGIRLKACGHVLGHRCALRWFELKNSCPFCRREVFVLGGEEVSGRVVGWF